MPTPDVWARVAGVRGLARRRRPTPNRAARASPVPRGARPAAPTCRCSRSTPTGREDGGRATAIASAPAHPRRLQRSARCRRCGGRRRRGTSRTGTALRLPVRRRFEVLRPERQCMRARLQGPRRVKAGHETLPQVHHASLPQHRLYFLPLPQGQGAFRPIFSAFAEGLGDPGSPSLHSTTRSYVELMASGTIGSSDLPTCSPLSNAISRRVPSSCTSLAVSVDPSARHPTASCHQSSTCWVGRRVLVSSASLGFFGALMIRTIVLAANDRRSNGGHDGSINV